MARHLRVEFPGSIYHVTCWMVGDWQTEKTFLFKDDADHERFLARLAERVEQFNIRLYLFVCMTNHFHLVFETPEANSSTFMPSLSTAYTVYYNLRHGRHGHLRRMQGEPQRTPSRERRNRASPGKWRRSRHPVPRPESRPTPHDQRRQFPSVRL